jgi:RNA polymerase sigma-70 factor (ECF subfamily)
MKEHQVELFVQMYEENVGRVYGFFGYRVASRESAEDLTQLTFERAMRNWELFDETLASSGTWLMAIARNILIDNYRRDRSSRQEPLEEADGREASLRHEEEFDLGIAPELEAALERLDERQRELIALRFGADLTGPEIADLSGLSLANVQQILSRSLRKLRSELGERKPAS